MKTGLPLFDWPTHLQPPLARDTDPVTSQEGAFETRRSGRLASQAQAVLAAVTRWPGCTSAELAQRMGADRYVASRRCPALANEGRVRRGAKKKCPVTGMASFTWWPTSGGRQ
ncbi:MAG: helix-turn-helix domain-containing protein [Sedimentisphaerales bacterium]|mgnify:CR=1 FL=1|jgi:hypothetical protein|nr:helix-turn-helix domain-containing protein [Sedimentisphaerales bacterium]NLT75658.1 MarR family transcriptional regulator [Planctomycetota bacterium]